MSASLLSAEEGKALYEALQSDPRFWPALVKDPKAAYQAKFGRELLPGQQVEVVHDSPELVTFVIPASGLRLPVRYTPTTGELTDDQLDGVSGGLFTATSTTTPGDILAFLSAGSSSSGGTFAEMNSTSSAQVASAPVPITMYKTAK